MSEFSVFFLIVCYFAFNAFCMNPSNLGLPVPPPPEDTEFGDCFFVHKMTGESLTNEHYSYRYICPEKLSNVGHQLPTHEKLWFFVGLFKGSETVAQEQDLPQFDYIPKEQSLLKFVFFKGQMAELMFTISKFEITFQSLQQNQAFYQMIYSNVNMKRAASNNIGVLHHIIPHGTGYRKMGTNVEALLEKVNNVRYITLNNERGEPLLIFSQREANILRIKPGQREKRQLLLRVNTSFYILTFSSYLEARLFSGALLDHLKALHMARTFGTIVSRFKENKITIDS